MAKVNDIFNAIGCYHSFRLALLMEESENAISSAWPISSLTFVLQQMHCENACSRIANENVDAKCANDMHVDTK